MASASPKRSASSETVVSERIVAQLRNETASLREAMEVERRAVKELRRQRAAEVRAVREEEARRRGDSLSDLRTRLEHEHQEALRAQRDALAKSVEAELTRALHAKDAELRQERAAAQRQQEALQQQLRDALRLHAAPDHDCHKIAAEAARLRELNAQLEERIQALAREASQSKSPRRTPKRAASVEATGERLVIQLRVEAASLREALEVERRAVRELRRQRAAELRAVREEEAKRRADSLSDLRTRLEHEHQEALRAQRDALAKSVEAELTRALHAKDAELRQERAATQRQQEALQQQLRDAFRLHAAPDHDCHKIAAEAARLRELNALLEERIRKLEGGKAEERAQRPHPDMDKLRVQVEERDQEIANLRQAALEKDRKLEQINSRCRYKEQIRQYCRFMELEPVVELEEDAGGGEQSATSSGPSSLSLTPYTGEVWVEDSVYSGLLREHVELQRVHRSLEARLRRSEARARQLKELRRSWTDQLQQLQAETQELRELNELLEFRILELEEGHDHGPWKCSPQRSARSPGPDTRDVCTDTENDDVSDSGVLSLPTSEELGSDIDLGVHDLKIDVFKNLSEYATINNAFSKFPGRMVATVSPFSEMGHSSHVTSEADKIVKEDPEDSLTKQLKNAECLQESGIFEGDAVEWISRGTQTEGPSLSGDLSAEIQKLTQFRARVEEERSGLLAGHELAFCRERLQLLEDKVRVYESSGEQQARLLAERLQRELHLAAQVKELSAKVARLQADNSRLEEERCELEEAENDTRLRCQKLEVKLQELIDKKGEVQAKLQQERRANANLRKNLADGDKWRREARYLETVLSKYEQHNYELEEREMELRHRLELLEGCWPAVTLWNVWRILCTSCTKRPPPLPVEYGQQSTSTARFVPRKKVLLKVSKRKCLEEKPLLDKGKRGLNVCEMKTQSVQTDEGLTCIELQKSKEVEDKLFKTIDELQEELSSLKERSKDWAVKNYSGHPGVPIKQCTTVVSVTDGGKASVELINTDDMDCMSRLQQLAQAEIDMMNRIVELEQKETAYMETLQQADDLWSELEGGYQKQLQSLRASEAELRGRLEAAESRHRASRQSDESRVVELEQALVELQGALRRTEDDKAALATKVATLSEALAVAEGAMERLQHEVDAVLKPRLCQERRLVADLQRDLAHKSDTMEAMQESYESEIEKLKNQFAIAKRQCLSAHNECYQLKAEVQELKITIQDLRTCMEKQKNDDEKTLIHLTNLLAEKDRELEEASLASRDAMVRSAQEELEEALLGDATGASPQQSEQQGEAATTSVQPPASDSTTTPEEEQACGHVGRIKDAATAHSKQIFQV